MLPRSNNHGCRGWSKNIHLFWPSSWGRVRNWWCSVNIPEGFRHSRHPRDGEWCWLPLPEPYSRVIRNYLAGQFHSLRLSPPYHQALSDAILPQTASHCIQHSSTSLHWAAYTSDRSSPAKWRNSDRSWSIICWQCSQAHLSAAEISSILSGLFRMLASLWGGWATLAGTLACAANRSSLIDAGPRITWMNSPGGLCCGPRIGYDRWLRSTLFWRRLAAWGVMRVRLGTLPRGRMMTILTDGVRGYRRLGLDFKSDIFSLLFRPVWYWLVRSLWVASRWRSKTMNNSHLSSPFQWVPAESRLMGRGMVKIP